MLPAHLRFNPTPIIAQKVRFRISRMWLVKDKEDRPRHRPAPVIRVAVAGAAGPVSHHAVVRMARRAGEVRRVSGQSLSVSDINDLHIYGEQSAEDIAANVGHQDVKSTIKCLRWASYEANPMMAKVYERLDAERPPDIEDR